MPSQPWTLTREHFLDEAEPRQLLAGVEATAATETSTSIFVDRLIIECLLWSGLQTSEFCRLQVKDVCLDNSACFTVSGKRERRRVVYLPDRLNALLQTYLDDVRPALVADAPALVDAFIINERGKAYERTALYRRVTRILKQHGFGERASVQLLRHTYGYLAYKCSGSNLLFTQRQLGHAHPMVTAVYAQFVEEDYGQIANDVVNQLTQFNAKQYLKGPST